MVECVQKIREISGKKTKKDGITTLGSIMVTLFLVVLFMVPTVFASDVPGQKTYERLSKALESGADSSLIQKLNEESRSLNWSEAEETEFVGNLRIVGSKHTGDAETIPGIYLIRKLTGELFILSVPENLSDLAENSSSPYAFLDTAFENKMEFKIKRVDAAVADKIYTFAQLTAKPEQVLLDRVFKASIILMLFFVMVGMGMTLTIKDFMLVFTKPRGILVGQLLQFGLMPFLAMVLGHVLGFYEAYPFIFVGMILITAIPGGVTSNLMTYYAKGDLALSISLTSFSTVLSIVFTPLLLAFYCSDMPEITIPVKVVIQTILILVIIPLILGMSFRGKWPELAKKMTPFFSALGIIALLVLIIAGVLSNLTIFTDTARYGVKFYLTVFSITMLGMLFGILFSKLFRIDNYQTRAISLETGLRNSALAMTIALLIQDSMGDFFSSMFVTSGIFGLIMYLAGIISIFSYKYLLPVGEQVEGVEEVVPV
ncbi:bile acid:sodium symporter family protein [bacterium]|nr:bile acid:sodium symporter family protein [bacterium]